MVPFHCGRQPRWFLFLNYIDLQTDHETFSIHFIFIFTHTHTHTHTRRASLIPPCEDQCELHRMTRMTAPDCAVICNLINTHTHTHTRIETCPSTPYVMSIILSQVLSTQTVFILFLAFLNFHDFFPFILFQHSIHNYVNIYRV